MHFTYKTCSPSIFYRSKCFEPLGVPSRVKQHRELTAVSPAGNVDYLLVV